MIGLTGCNLQISPDELIKPPKLLEEDDKINNMIEKFLPDGVKLENISSKEGLSAVKKIDISGDGVEEILVFHSKEEVNTLHTVIFEGKNESHKVVSDIEVPGQFFEEIIVEDITGNGVKDMIINTSEKRVNNGIYKMNIYSYEKDPNKFFEIEYGMYVLDDLNKDGNWDIVILNQEELLISFDHYRYNKESAQMEFIDETFLDKKDILNMAVIESDTGERKVELKFKSSSEEEIERVFFVLDKDGELKREEE